MNETAIIDSIYRSFVSYTPNLLGFFLLLFLGYGIGKLAGKIVEEIVKRSKIENTIFKEKPIFPLSSIFSIMISWGIYILFLKAGVDLLGIKAISDILSSILYFIPKFLAFITVFIAGYVLSEYLRVSIERSNIEYKRIAGKIAFWFGLYVSALIALPIIGIDVFILQVLLIVVVVVLLLPISVGLALTIKDEIRPIIRKHLRKFSKI